MLVKNLCLWQFFSYIGDNCETFTVCYDNVNAIFSFPKRVHVLTDVWFYTMSIHHVNTTNHVKTFISINRLQWYWNTFRNFFQQQMQKADPNYGVGINPISRLIQIQQAQQKKEPVYTLLNERGLPRRREFVIQVTTSLSPVKGITNRVYTCDCTTFSVHVALIQCDQLTFFCLFQEYFIWLMIYVVTNIYF